jgi:ABC-2 type transport system permease protein
MSASPYFAPRRLKALVVKESLQISRDPSSILIAFILPLILLFIFGYGISLDSDRIRIGLVKESASRQAGDLAASLRGSTYLEVSPARDIRELRPRLTRGELRGIVVIPADFTGRLLHPEKRHQAIQIITDGSEPQLATFVEAYVQGAFRGWLESAYADELSATPMVTVEPRFRYNAAVRSRNFLVPGSLAVIMTVVGTLLTALVVAREWERGTMEALLASPVSRLELILGKIIPYFILGMISFLFCSLVAVLVYQVPLRGSITALVLTGSLFLLTALGMGLSISAAARDQFVAAQIALNVAFLPAFILSGFIFEIKSMPLWIQGLTHVIPAKYFVTGLQTVFQAGDLWPLLLPNLAFLGLMAALFLGLTARKMVRRLDA